MRNKLIKLVSRSTRCRLFWDHFKTCWDVCGAFEDINLDKLNHKHNNEALSLFQFWDIPTMFGTFRDKFWDMRLFYFWDISGHQENKNPRNPVRKPLRRAIDRSKLTNQTRYVRVTYGHFKIFWDIFWDILGHFGTSVEHVYERPKFDPPASWVS